MRQSFATGQFILLYSIIVLIYEFFNCYDICTKPELEKYEKTIFESDASSYSHHYYYSRTIRSNQSLPDVRRSFENVDADKEIFAKFPSTFYGAAVIKYRITKLGKISVYGQPYSGKISNHMGSNYESESETLDQGESIAVRERFYRDAYDKGQGRTFSITTMIHPKGKISFYYENIPKFINETEKQSSFSVTIPCGKDKKEIVMNVPGKWIQSGTLVEYEALGDCPKHNSTEACHGATTLNTRCIWCETANMCITSNDKDLHEFKVNGCKNNSLDVNAPTELTTPATNELNKTNPSNESHLERKSLSHVYIVVPLVICFLILCIGCGIWLWFYRRERVHQWFSRIASQFSSSR